MSDQPKLGEILVRAGVIDEMQLSSALGEQARWGRRLGVTLIKMGMVEEAHLVRALALQLGLPVATLSGKRISDAVIGLVPSRIASEHGVIPLFVKEGGARPQLFLGMEDPSNLAVLDDLGFRTGMEIRPVMVAPSELGDAMDRYYLGHTGPAPIELPPSRGASTHAPTEAKTDAESEPMGETNLRVITRDPKAPEPSAPMEAPKSEPASEPAKATAVVEPPVAEPEPEQMARPAAVPAAKPAVLPEGLTDDVARALEETERTRIVARAITQLLIDKQLVTIEEIQAAIAHQKEGRSS